MSSALQISYEKRQTAWNKSVRDIKAAQSHYKNNIPPQIKETLQRELIIATNNLALILYSAGIDKKKMCDAKMFRDNESMRRNIQLAQLDDQKYGSISADIEKSTESVITHRETTEEDTPEIIKLSYDLKILLSQRM